MRKILLIDNYDSFVYNLRDYLITSGADVVIKKNDSVTHEDINRISPDAIVISPGPCSPDEAGIVLNVIATYKKSKPILGVCLGHQAIAQSFSASISKASKPVHGIISNIAQTGKSKLFAKIPTKFKAVRYHSLAIRPDSVPECLCVTAIDENDQCIMAISHNEYKIHGVQFHPESICSEYGLLIIRNFLNMIN